MIGAGGPNQEEVSSDRIAEGCIGSKVGNTEVLPEGCIRTNGAVEEHRRSGVEVIWLYINKDDISKQSMSADVSCLGVLSHLCGSDPAGGVGGKNSTKASLVFIKPVTFVRPPPVTARVGSTTKS